MASTILITGSSSGIGKATAEYFSGKGWNVIATMRDIAKGECFAKQDNVLVTRLDVLDRESINNAVSEGIAKFGKIDVLLNNAGYGAYGPLEAYPRENILQQFNINVIGLLDVTRAILPHFRANRDGIVINVSSVGGKITFPFSTIYHGTKFAVEGITEALALELEAIGCRAKLIEPGFVKTNFGGNFFNSNNDDGLAEYQELIGKLFKGFEQILENSSEASLVAEVIYRAATDGTDTLRYIAGSDAKEFITMRVNYPDDKFISEFKKQLGI